MAYSKSVNVNKARRIRVGHSGTVEHTKLISQLSQILCKKAANGGGLSVFKISGAYRCRETPKVLHVVTITDYSTVIGKLCYACSAW